MILFINKITREIKHISLTCWDNAPIEPFFGHFKDEVEYKECKNLCELKKLVDSSIQEYNHHRYQ